MSKRTTSLFLAITAVVALLPFGSLFGSYQYLWMVVAACASASVFSLATRKRTFFLATIVSFVFFVGFIVFAVFHIGVPATSELSNIWHQINGSWRAMTSADVPITNAPRFLIVPTMLVWIGVWAAQELAQRTSWIIAPLLPVLVMFTIALSFAGNYAEASIPLALVFSCLALLMVFSRVRVVDSHAEETRSGIRQNTLALGAVLGIAALTVSVLPIAKNNDRFGLHGLLGRDQHLDAAITPIAQLREGLTSTNQTKLFSVTFSSASPDPKVIVDRVPIAMLEQYDGIVWSTRGTFAVNDGRVPAQQGLSKSIKKTELMQHYELGPYQSSFLPALGRPSTVRGQSIRIDQKSGAIVSMASRKDGMQYEVKSTVISYDPRDLLRRSPDSVPHADADLAALTKLPAETKEMPNLEAFAGDKSLENLAPIEALAILEKRLRSDEFGYDTQAPAGHSLAALDTFLTPLDNAPTQTPVRIGTAEQFATAFAVIARLEGMPSRVAVGYRVDPEAVKRKETIDVYPKDIHAWPEVYFDGHGWVRFEPTNATARRPAPPQLASPDVAPPTPNAVTSPVDNGKEAPDAQPEHTGDRGLPLWPFILVALAVLLPWVVFGSRKIIRWRRQNSGTEIARVFGAWQETRDCLRIKSVNVDRWMTVRDVARSVEIHDSDLRARLHDLATQLDRAVYSPLPPTERHVEDAWDAVVGIEYALSKRSGKLRRLFAPFDSRPLIFSLRDLAKRRISKRALTS